MNTKFRGLALGLVICGVLFALNGKQLASSWLLNVAQSNRIHKVEQTELFGGAAALALDNSHVRWQAAEAYARVNKLSTSAYLMGDSIDRFDNKQAQRFFFSALTFDERFVDVLRNITPGSIDAVTSGSAARLLAAAVDQPNLIQSNNTLKWLLARLSLLDPFDPRTEFLENTVRAGNWDSELGQKLLSAVRWRAKSPGSLPVPACRERHISDVYLRSTFSELLGLSLRTAEFGSNLTPNGDFEMFDYAADTPTDWSESFLNGGPLRNLGALVAGIDPTNSFSGCRSLRIDGIYFAEDKTLEPARAGLIHAPIRVNENQPYMWSFVYRTSRDVTGGASFWVSPSPNILLANEIWLPPTNDAWVRVSVLAWNRYHDIDVQPLFSMWGMGTVWFDDFSFRSVHLPESIIPQDAVVTMVPAQIE